MAASASKEAPAGVANGGYWGIPLHSQTQLPCLVLCQSGQGFAGPLTASLESTDGQTLASAEIRGLTGDWKKFEVDLKTKRPRAFKENVFKLTTAEPGTIWLQQVSLFPPTFNDRPNGNRPDLMQLLADMHPKFLRLPGGNYLEGDYINERFDWKKTIGDVAQRPGHRSPWNYWSTDGLGLLEYLEWCEDLHMEPLLAVFAGYALRHDYIKPGPDLEPYVQDALDEIEYLTGDAAATKWGAQRAKDGHPAPFPLHYVEVGNEDWFDESGSYDGRFTQFFERHQGQVSEPASHCHRPRSTARVPDLMDEHYYKSQEEMEAQAHMYDTRARGGKTKIFVGEWATRVGSPTPNMAGALGDAAWMCGMERNSDLVLMHSYAPLFVNVSDLGKGRSMQWRSDLIGYDALTSYGSPSYYAQVMFSSRHGNNVLATDAQNLPTYDWKIPPRHRNGVGVDQPASVRQVPSIFFDATRDSASGTIFVKVVNRAAAPQPLEIKISGVASVEPKGIATVLQADKPDDTNSITNPKHLVPVTKKVSGLGTDFTRAFPAYSITVLELQAK